MSLTDKKCLPCEGGIEALDAASVEKLLPQVPAWRLEEGRLRRDLRFPDFSMAMRFIDGMAALAEQEGHHPDFSLHGWNKVDVALTTHAANGLTENDFVLAAKIDLLLPSTMGTPRPPGPR